MFWENDPYIYTLLLLFQYFTLFVYNKLMILILHETQLEFSHLFLSEMETVTQTTTAKVAYLKKNNKYINLLFKLSECMIVAKCTITAKV